MGATTVDQLYENMQSIHIIPKLTPVLLTEVEHILDNRPSRMCDHVTRWKSLYIKVKKLIYQTCKTDISRISYSTTKI